MRARRLAMRLALCAALGAATTVGVAWGGDWLYLRGHVAPELISRFNESSGRAWMGSTSAIADRLRIGDASIDAVGRARLVEFAQAGRPPGWLFDAWTLSKLQRSKPGMPTVMASGWPFRSMRGVAWNAPGGWDSIHFDAVYRRGNPHNPQSVLDGLYPLRPIPLGFAADTAIYAAAWWALLLPGAVRRRVRAARGRCTRCAYDLAGHPGGPCPECGHEARRARTRAENG